MWIAEQERQEEVLTSLRPARRVKHIARKVPSKPQDSASPATEATEIPALKKPIHPPSASPKAVKPTEKVNIFESLFILYTLFCLSFANKFHSYTG